MDTLFFCFFVFFDPQKSTFRPTKVCFLATKVCFLAMKVRFLATKVVFLATKVRFLTHKTLISDTHIEGKMVFVILHALQNLPI